ncbi:subtilisin-like serine protease [Pleurotus pulmonarius]|nr:subtilisin-like serine protease [Pleurotus pulmonarius]
MRIVSAILASFATLAVSGSPAAIKTGQLIVKLKDGASSNTLLKSIGEDVTHRWEIGFKGFAGTFSEKSLVALRSSPDVESISEDGLMHAFAIQTDAPWGLARLSSENRLENNNASALNFSYTYDSAGGAGVDVYVVDTGIYTEHTEFEGRARWGATFGGYAPADGNGHGTHCAGVVAGHRFGVAKAASVIAVKVLSDTGSATVSDIISGLNFVIASARASGRPSVVLMALGGSASTALDNAVTAVTSAGIHVAAGNSNTDAGNTSPARVPSVITVGAITIADARSSASNYGSVVDVYAPGQNIISAWIGSPTATNIISGTSPVTPHFPSPVFFSLIHIQAASFVAGLVAYLISVHGNLSPAAMKALIKSLSLNGVLTGIPAGTANSLAHNA